MTDVTLRIRGDATGVIRASADASRAVSGITDASQRAGAAGQRAGRQIAEGAEQAEQASQRAAQAMRSLVASAAAAFGTAQIVATVDAYTRMTGALTLATDSAAELASTQQMLFDIAQATRAPLEATVGLYTKLSGALKEAGATSAELASITSTISQAMAVSGTSAAAAEGAIQQLGQAFASGVLRGDEFNSVNEAAPRLMQALAASLGVTRGELRALAEEGELTSEKLSQALTGEQARKIAEEFAKLPPTLAQATTVAGNALTQFVGKLDQALGASASVAQAIITAAGALPEVAAVWRAEFGRMTSDADSFFSLFLGNLDLIGFNAADVAGDIINSFAVLPSTLRVFFTAVIAAGDVAWALLYDGAMSLELGLQAIWLKIQRAGIKAFGDLAAGAAGELDSLLAAVRGNASAIAAALNVVAPGAGAALQASLSSLDSMASLQERVRAQTANATSAIDEQIAALERRTAEIGDATAAVIEGARVATAAAVEEHQANLDRVAALRQVNTAIANTVTNTRAATAATNEGAAASRAAADALRAQAQAAGSVGVGLAGASASVSAFAGATASATASQTELSDASQQAAQESAQYWGGFGDAITNALGEGFVNGFKGTVDRIKDIFKRLLADMASAAISQRIVIPIMTALGLPTGGMQSGNLLQSILGGGQQGGGGLLSSIGSALGLGGRAGGFLGSVLGIGGGTLGAVGTAGAASGVGAAGAGAFAGATAGGAAGIGGTLGAIGSAVSAFASVAGPIALAAMAINAIAGGRLFGTSYKTNAAGTSLNFGQGGATGNNFEEQSRRRALFQGTRRRTVTSALDDEAQAGIDQIFEQIGAAMTAAAAQLGVTVPERITGTFLRRVDDKGNVLEEAGTVLGVKYTESLEVFSRRLLGENVIGVIDAALGSMADRIGQSASDTAARWRSDADLLVDGASMLAAAVGDIRNGTALLGDASIDAVADFVESIAGTGESLTAAYARAVQSTALLTEAVSLMGVDLDLTRQQFVEFAAGIAEAAGGLEEAQRLFTSYFQTFYTEQERGLVQLQQARQRAAGLAGGLGLDLGSFTGADGAAAFRQLFESQLPSLSAEAVAQWLTFAEALGVVIDLQGRYTEAVISTAETIADFMQGIDAALAEFAPAETLAAQLEAQRAANVEMIAQATALGASEAELARVRALGDARIGQIIGSVSQQTAVLTSAMRRLGVAASGTAEDLAVAASAISGDFQALFDEFLGTFYTDTERQALELSQAAQNLAQALAAAGLASDELISREQLRAQIEAALAAGNASLAESLLRVARAMNEVEGATASATQQLINNGNGSQFGSNPGGSGLGFGDGPGGSIGGAGSQLVNTIEDIRRGLRDWLQSLTTGDLSPLRPRDQLREARAELARLIQAAQGGDLEAMRQLSSAGDTVLRLGQQVFRGADYAALFAEVRALVGGVAGVGSPIGGPGSGNTRPVDDLGRSATNAAAALDLLAARAGMPPGSLSVPSPQFGGVSAQASSETAARPVVTELQRGRADAARENAQLRAEIAELSARMDRMSAAAERSAQELARANDYKRV